MTPNPPYQPGPHPGQPAYPPAARKSSTGRTLAIAAAVVVLMCIVGSVFLAAIGSSDDGRPARPLSAQDQANRAAADPSTSLRPKLSATPTKPGQAVVIPGTYGVGEDIPAGRYKTVERAGGDCYWSITRDGAFVDAGASGGFPSFTVRKGDEIEIGYTCPAFERTGKK